jgi:hypothetical protein
MVFIVTERKGDKVGAIVKTGKSCEEKEHAEREDFKLHA